MNTTVLAIIVLLTALLSVAVAGYFFYRIAQTYFDNQQKAMMLQSKMDERRETLKVVTPLRLQAYERMALFLERISPNSLVLRIFKPGMDMKALQFAMTKSIRDEWEHNLSQQVYLTSEAWNRIREAKEEMINLINGSAVKLPADADPATLAGIIFQTTAQSSNPAQQALDYLHKEMEEL